MSTNKSRGSSVIGAVTLVLTVVLLIAIVALIVGSVLGASVFQSITVINITELTDGFSGFVTGIVTFLAVIGIIVGVMWLVSYIRPLFSKDEGIQGFDAN